MKLIFKYTITDNCTYSYDDIIPFEYSSIEDFQYMVLCKIDEYRKELKLKGDISYFDNGYIKILGHEISASVLEHEINHNVFTLEDWFNKNCVK